MKCPAGCGRRRVAGLLVCEQCWELVPEQQRVAMFKAAQAWARYPSPSTYAAWVGSRRAIVDSLPDPPPRRAVW